MKSIFFKTKIKIVFDCENSNNTFDKYFQIMIFRKLNFQFIHPFTIFTFDDQQ